MATSTTTFVALLAFLQRLRLARGMRSSAESFRRFVAACADGRKPA